MTKTRTETDTFGPIDVDASRYWGAQAQRSLGNFKIGWEKQPQPVVLLLAGAFGGGLLSGLVLPPLFRLRRSGGASTLGATGRGDDAWA